MNRHTLLFALWLLLCLPCCADTGNNYPALRDAALKQCEAIDPSEFQTGLFFNPEGYRSYYVQSECFQRAAIQFRDPSLCGKVRRRWALFSSSWAVAPAQCSKLVSSGIAADRVELEKDKQRYTSGPIRLQSFRIQRNGNGRDFDILPKFSSSGNANGYTLTFEIVGEKQQPILLHSDGYYVDANANLNIYVRQVDVRSRFPEFLLNHPYKVRATMTYSIGMGGLSGYWSNGFIESVFPMRERSQSLTLESTF